MILKLAGKLLAHSNFLLLSSNSVLLFLSQYPDEFSGGKWTFEIPPRSKDCIFSLVSVSFNLFLPSENTGSLKFPGKLLMLLWRVTPFEVLKWPFSSSGFLYCERLRPTLSYP